MRALEVFKARHEFARDLFYDYLWEDHDDDALRTPLNDQLNPLVWIAWHVARVEDAGVSRFVLRQPQVLETGQWNEKMGIDVTHFGFGAERDEVLKLAREINMDGLRDYWQTVIDMTMTGIEGLPPEKFDEVLSEDEVREVVVTEGVAIPRAHGVVDTYAGWTRLEALYHFSVTHYYWHGGEVRTIESMMPQPEPEAEADE